MNLSMDPTIGASQKTVRLELSLELSRFTETAIALNTLPPKIQSSVRSTVTVPDRQVFVVGGLTQVGDSNTTGQNNFYLLLRAKIVGGKAGK